MRLGFLDILVLIKPLLPYILLAMSLYKEKIADDGKCTIEEWGEIAVALIEKAVENAKEEK